MEKGGMDIEKFKSDLRTVINANPQQINFKITFSDPRLFELYTTKKEFGERILQLLNSPDLKNIEPTMVRIDGYLGRFFDGMEGLIITKMYGDLLKNPKVRTDVKEIFFKYETLTEDALKIDVENFEIL